MAPITKEALVELLKGKGKISLSEFKKENPNIECSEFQFYHARKTAMGEVYPSRLKERKTAKIVHEKIKSTLIPQSERDFLEKEFETNPDVRYRELRESGKITMSDVMFYTIRKSVIGPKKDPVRRSYRRVSVYRTILESDSIKKEAIPDIREIIECINREPGFRQVITLVELVNGIVEIRISPRGGR